MTNWEELQNRFVTKTKREKYFTLVVTLTLTLVVLLYVHSLESMKQTITVKEIVQFLILIIVTSISFITVALCRVCPT